MIAILNSIFCAIIALNGTAFYLIIEKKGRIYKKLSLLESSIVRFGLIILIVGSLYSALKCETELLGEVLLNLSLAILLTWGAFFHRKLNNKK